MEQSEVENEHRKANNEQVTPPRDKFMYRFTINTAAFLGIARFKYWDIPPYHRYFLPFYTVHGIIANCAPFCLVSQLMYIYANFSELEFDTLLSAITIVPITACITVKVYSSKTAPYEKAMREFMGRIHLYNKHLQEPHNDYIKAKLIQTENFSRFAIIFLASFLILDWVTWTIVPLVDFYKNRELIERREKKLETCMYFFAPFDYSYNINNWLLMHIMGAYVNMCGVAIVTIFDALSFYFIFNLLGHIKILRYKMKTMFKDAELTHQETSEKLEEIIRYHAYITECFDVIQHAFGLSITANYIQNLVVDSLILYQVMDGVTGGRETKDSIVFILMFTVYLGGLALMSFTLEELRRQSENLSDYIYFLPWESMSKRNKTSILLILAKMQPAFVFKGAGGLNTGVQPMISIIKTTFSYYVMLNNNNAARVD